MTPTIFAYVVVFTLLLAAAAAAAEWGTEGRVPRRHFWTAAILLAVLAPPVIVAWQTLGVSARAGVPAEAITTIVLYPGHTVAGPAMLSRVTKAEVARVVEVARAAVAVISGASARTVTVALELWLFLSISLAAWLAAGIFHWRRVRRAWRSATLDGVEVDISPFTGPAVMGFLSHRIVLPAWATTMPAEHRRLVLAHECEHISACDPQRLALAIAALLLMPWNVALWWCAARLRRAIELDCDARVLRRFPGAKDYGYVLLEVAARGRNTGPLAGPMVGLLRLPSELERRLRAMTRTRSAGARMIAAGSAAAVVAIGAAFAAPVPTVRGLGSAHVSLAATPRVGILSRTVRLPLRAASDTVPAAADGRATSRRRVDSMTVMLRTLRSKSAALDSSQRDMEPMAAALRLAEQSIALHDSTRPGIGAVAAHRFVMLRPDAGPADAMLKRLERADWRAQQSLIDSAVAHYYPSLVAHPDEGAVLWFVADSAGHVLQTKRDDTFARHTLMADSVPVRFPNISLASIESVSLIRKDLGARSIRVTWTTVGAPVR